MPPKKKNNRKKQNQRKGSATNVNTSTGSSPSTNAASTSASNVTPPNAALTDTPPSGGQSTTTSSTVEQELVTPGALDLRFSQLGHPDVAPVSESGTERGSNIELATPTASDVLDDLDQTPEGTRSGRQDDIEYQNEVENEMEEPGMKTPTQQEINAYRGPGQDGQQTRSTEQAKPAEAPQTAKPEGNNTGIKAATAAAVAATAAAHMTQETPEQGSAQHASHEEMVEPPQNGQNPFSDSKLVSHESPEVKAAGLNQEEDNDKGFDEVTLGPKDPAPVTEQGKHIKILAPEPVKEPLANPAKPHTPGYPFVSPGMPLERESHEEYLKRTHLGYNKPRPSEPFMHSNVVPDAVPQDGQNIAHDGGANLPATEERQNLWAPGQQGSERNTGGNTAANTTADTGANTGANPSVPSTTSAALWDVVAASSSSDVFAIEESLTTSTTGSYEPAELEECIGFSRESQPGLWKDPHPYRHEEEKGRQLSTTEYNDNNAAPTSYPFPNTNPFASHVSVAQHDNHYPKPLLSADPNVPLAFKPTTSNHAPFGRDDPAKNRRESIPLASGEGNLDGHRNPWTRSHESLVKTQIPPPVIEVAALSTSDLTRGRFGRKVSNPFSYRARTSTSSGGPTARTQLNQTLMPTLPILARKHININESQLRSARPSILTPRGVPPPFKQQYLDHGTSSGRSTPWSVGKPPPPVVEADLENINLDDRTFTNPPRFRNQSLATPAPVFMRVRNSSRERWFDFRNWPLRARLLAIAALVVIVALVIGLAVGLSRRNSSDGADEKAS